MKGQVTLEFFILFVFVIFIFIFIFGTAVQTNIILNKNIAQKKSDKIAFEIASAVNRVFINGNGSLTKITIPSNYSIYYYPRSIVVVDANNNSGSSAVLPDVNISVPSGSIEIFIKNINNKVIISSS